MILTGFRLQVQDHEDEWKVKEDRLEAEIACSKVAEAEIVRLKRRLQDMEVQQE